MKSLKHLNKYFWKYKWRLSLGFLFIVVTNLFAVLSPYLVNVGVDVLSAAKDNVFEPIAKAEKADSGYERDSFFENFSFDLPESLNWFSDFFGYDQQKLEGISTFQQFIGGLILIAGMLAVFYIVIYLIKGVFLFLTRQTIIVMSRLIEFDLKNEIFGHYQKLDLSFYKRNNTGDLMNRISEDVSKVRMYLGPAIMYTLNLVVLITLVIIFMLYIDWELTLYALSPLPFMSVCIYYVSTVINKKSESVQAQQSKLSTLVQENISGVRVLKAYQREEDSEDRFREASDLYKFKTLNLIKTEALFMPIIVLLVGLSTILTIYIGGVKVMEGTLGLGEIFQFVFYVNMLTWPFASVGWVTSLVQKAEASQKRINEFLETQPDIENISAPIDFKPGKIAFSKVSFTYPDSGILALDEVSFEIDKGQILAIVGRTGSGKSTIANLLCRMYDPDDGKVLVNGTDIKTLDVAQLRSSVGYVPQEVFLFSESIEQNIGFGIDISSEAVIRDAAIAADIDENIQGFPNKYQTPLGERGINLSGGQKQRISIARAIIKEPDILIFDDCLSAVDTETEETILSSLKSIMDGKTSVIISHRISSIRHADKIIVIEAGKVIEEGTHASLIDLDGVYADLHRKQMLDEQVA